MTQFLVKWEIDIEAETATEAASMALEIQRDPESIATVFEVRKAQGAHPYIKIDLDDGRYGPPINSHSTTRINVRKPAEEEEEEEKGQTVEEALKGVFAARPFGTPENHVDSWKKVFQAYTKEIERLIKNSLKEVE